MNFYGSFLFCVFAYMNTDHFRVTYILSEVEKFRTNKTCFGRILYYKSSFLKAVLMILFFHAVFLVTVTRNKIKTRRTTYGTYGVTLRRFHLNITVVAKQHCFFLTFALSIAIKTLLSRFYFQAAKKCQKVLSEFSQIYISRTTFLQVTSSTFYENPYLGEALIHGD
jgi:hypothetical protein